MRLLFFSPMPSKPTGGVRVIYSYVAKFRNMGIDAYIYHPFDNYSYKYTHDNVPVYRGKKISKSDHVVIPDVYVSRINSNNFPKDLKYSLLIQNPYILRSLSRFSNLENILLAFSNASKILCISDDTMEMIKQISPLSEKKLMRVSWSMQSNSFLSKEKKTKINNIYA